MPVGGPAGKGTIVMGRVWLMAALLYGYGHPGFDGHRPAALDLPLQSFHRAVDTAAGDLRRTVVALDDKAQSVRSLLGGLHQLDDAFGSIFRR